MDDRRLLSGGYRLDKSDSDILVLRREDGSFVAAFSALGCTEGSVRRATEEDRANGAMPTSKNIGPSTHSGE